MLNFSDLWREDGRKTRTTMLADFDRKAGMPALDGVGPKGGYPIGQAEALIRIEHFVNAVLRSKQPAYTFKGIRGDEVVTTSIGRYLRDTIPLAGMFDSKHDYSEKPTLFLRACWQINVLLSHNLSRMFRRNANADLQYAEAMNAIIDLIRAMAKDEWYGRCVHDRRYETIAKGKSLAGYTAAVLRYYARTLVVRVDFSYLGGADASVTIDRVYQDLHDFLELIQYHRLFEHLVGYGWAIEQSERKGFHIHLMFFFNGSEVRQDMTIGFAIGDLWQRVVTFGRGSFRNCNAHKDEYDELGIGMIHRNSEQECARVVRFMQYLCKSGEFLDKDNQYLRIKPLCARTFGMGQAPDLWVTRPGRRPREPQGPEAALSGEPEVA